MKITKGQLIGKLQALDDKLLNIWLDDQMDLHDDERWEIFIVLLETRVDLLKTCKDAGVALSPDICMPPWLEKLTSSTRETRLRDLKVLYEEIKNKKSIKAYEDMSNFKKDRDAEV